MKLQPRKEEPMPRSVPLQSNTQRAAILRLLISARGAWVPLYEITPLAAQYNTRIFEHRKRFTIENKSEVVDGVRHSWFRLVNSAPAPPPKPAPPKSWEQICAERNARVNQPHPTFELVP